MTTVTISAKDVNKLRKATGAGMMDCKKALKEANGDFDAAIDVLRKKGQKVAAKRADRDATEGAAIARTNDAANRGIAFVLSSETDFVAKNEDFTNFAEKIAEQALSKFPSTTNELLALDLDSRPISEHISDMIGKIGEKIEISEYETLEAPQVVAYTHAGNRVGVLIGLNEAGDTALQVGKDIAMQAAAMKPVALDESDVAPEIRDKELEIGREKALQEGKPEHLVDRIAQGNLKRFYKDNTLLNQQYVKDSSKTVKEYISGSQKGLEVVGFKRVATGG